MVIIPYTASISLWHKFCEDVNLPLEASYFDCCINSESSSLVDVLGLGKLGFWEQLW